MAEEAVQMGDYFNRVLAASQQQAEDFGDANIARATSVGASERLWSERDNAARRNLDAAVAALEQGFDASELAALTANMQASSFGSQSVWHQYFADVSAAEDALRSGEALARAALETAQRDAEQDYRDAVAVARQQLAIDRATQAQAEAVADVATHMNADYAEFMLDHAPPTSITAEQYHPTFADALPTDFDLYGGLVGGTLRPVGEALRDSHSGLSSSTGSSSNDDPPWRTGNTSALHWSPMTGPASWWGWSSGTTPTAPDDAGVTWHRDGYSPTTSANAYSGWYGGTSWDDYGTRIDHHWNMLGQWWYGWGGWGGDWVGPESRDLQFGGGWTGASNIGGWWWGWGSAPIYDITQPASILGNGISQEEFEQQVTIGWSGQYWQLDLTSNPAFPESGPTSSGATLVNDLTTIIGGLIPGLPAVTGPTATSLELEVPRISVPAMSGDYFQSFANLNAQRLASNPQTSSSPNTFMAEPFDVEMSRPEVELPTDVTIGNAESVDLDGADVDENEPLEDLEFDLQFVIDKVDDQRKALPAEYVRLGYDRGGGQSAFWLRAAELRKNPVATPKPGDDLVQDFNNLLARGEQLRTQQAAVQFRDANVGSGADTQNWSLAMKEQLWAAQKAYTKALAEYRAALKQHERASFWSRSDAEDALHAAKINLQQAATALGDIRGQAPQARLVAGDQALEWSRARKLYEVLKYAYEHDKFSGEVKERVEQLLALATDPKQLSLVLSQLLMMAGVKKMLCKAGATGLAGAAISAGEGAAFALRMQALMTELDGITFTGEVADAVPTVVDSVTGFLMDQATGYLLKKIKCFVAGTQVVVAMHVSEDGTIGYETKNIEDIRKHDLVLAREEHGTKVGLHRVVETYRRTAWELRLLEFTAADGTTQTLKTTDEHPFWIVNRNEFAPAGDLRVGEQVAGPDGQIQTLTASQTESHPEGVPVFNFMVADAHTYFVKETQEAEQPILVHNANPNEYNGSSSEAVAKGKMTVPAGEAKGALDRLPGRIGKTGIIKSVPNAEALDELFESLSSRGRIVDSGTYAGVVKELSDGTIIRRRPRSRSGGATLDITMPNGTVIKVHIAK